MAFAFILEDEKQFGAWLNLNLESLAWEGKHRASFDEFWRALFHGPKDAAEIIERINHAQRVAKTGPLYSWMGWLRDRFLIYSFMRSELKLSEFCQRTSTEESWLCHILSDYFLSVLPQSENQIREALEVGNRLSPNRHQDFAQIAQRIGLDSFPQHGNEDDMMLSIEVTLFPQWGTILKELKKDVFHLRLDWANLRRKLSWRRQFRFFREVVLLLSLAAVLIVGLRQANTWWESTIVKRIKLLEPNFFGLDLNLLYRPEDHAQRQIELSNEEIEKLERIEGAQSFDEIKDIRFDPESDEVTLTSVEEIPAFSSGAGKRSEFEESKKGGYRDMGAGTGGTKAYRVLLTSADPVVMRQKILPIIKSFQVTPIGNVKPGTEIPGGIYFNLAVPSSELKNFLGEISGTGDATIFESNAREATIPGKNRVFIWVKLI